MRKLIIIFVGLFLSTQFSTGQIVKMQIGQNWSKIEGINGRQIRGYTKPFLGKNVFIGFEYMDRKFLNLSSSLGYIIKKGEESYSTLRPNGGSDLVVNKTNLGYLSVNTTLDLKYPIRDMFFPFISIGPRLDYLISNKSESTMEILSSAVVGLTLGGGLKFRLSKILFGIRTDHYWNFNKNARLPAMAGYSGFTSPENMIEKTTLLSFTIAYKLK